jgi:tetratricopeptide (TPR) repeat protein
MYLKGSKWSMMRRKKRSNPWSIIVLVGLVAGALYFNQVVVPAIPPLFIPTPTPTRSPESFITDAENQLKEGKIVLAIEAYQTAIQVNPKNAALYLTLARLQISTGDYPGALINAENALLVNSNNSMAQAIRGWILGFQEDYLQAESALNRAIELDPGNGTAYAFYAEVLANKSIGGLGDLGTIDKAIEFSRKAQDLAPGAMETHRARGFVLEYTGNYAEAVPEFEAAIAISPNIADLHLALGRNYRYLEQYDRAVEEFNRANALNPADPLPDGYTSRTYATVGEFAKAVQYAQQAVIDEPDNPNWYGNLGVMFARNQQNQEAVDALRLAIRGGIGENGTSVEGIPLNYGRIAEYYSTFGLTLARLGECGEALQISQSLQQGVPNDEIAAFNAEEIITTCKALLDTPPTPTLDLTQIPAETATPIP